MKPRRLFRTGRCVVVAIPKSYLAALRLVAGSDVVISIKDRAMHISKAVIIPESMMGAPDAPAGATGARKESV